MAKAKPKDIDIERFHHANIYYITMLASLILMVFMLVQGVIFHIDFNLYLAVGCYTMAVLFFAVAASCFNRGRGHYHYHGHL